MNPLRLLQSCFRSILRNRMRSLLTSLGIIIGVGSVIIMLAIGEGAQRAIEERIAAMGTNLIQVTRMGGGHFRRAGGTVHLHLTRQDAQVVRYESSFAMAVSGIVQRNLSVTGGGHANSTTVMGVEPDFFFIRSWNIDEGFFFGDEDMLYRNRVAVIGATPAARFFEGYNPVGQIIRIGNDNFTVIGLLERKGAGPAGHDQDDVIMVPLDTALTRIWNTRNINSIAISVVDRRFMEAAQNETELILRDAHRLSPRDTPSFEILNSSSLIEMASETSRTLTMLLAAIAGVSLLVGGIGIMNIMLVSVTERTREVGIRMAVGARKRDILLQFLSEAVFLSFLGGIMGIGLAFLTCEILAAAGIPTSVNPFVVIAAALFACLIGIFFGFYPARKAANLYPIDALRYE